MITKVIVFKVKKTTNKNGKEISFDTFFGSYKDKKFQVKLTNDVKDKLSKEDKQFPLLFELDNKRETGVDEEGNKMFTTDYFFTSDKYTDRHGEQATQHTCVIRDYVRVSQPQLESKSFDDFIKEV